MLAVGKAQFEACDFPGFVRCATPVLSSSGGPRDSKLDYLWGPLQLMDGFSFKHSTDSPPNHSHRHSFACKPKRLPYLEEQRSLRPFCGRLEFLKQA